MSSYTIKAAGAALAGPYKSSERRSSSTSYITRKPKSQQPQPVQTAARILLAQKRYPEAVDVTSVMDLSIFDDEEFPRIARGILHSCLMQPGDFVRGATKFITGLFENEAVEFLVAAGFSRTDAERIAPDGWVYQFSKRYHIKTYEQITKELSDNLAKSEIGRVGPRDREASIQGCGPVAGCPKDDEGPAAD